LPIKLFNYLISLRSKTSIATGIILCLMFFSCHNSQAQSLKHFVGAYQFGFESSFGVKSFQLSSNIPVINNLNVLSEGGTIGIVCGSKSLVIKARQGFYYSASAVSQTVDERRSTVLLNFYPFYYINPDFRIRPYLVMGIEKSSLFMHGYYDGDDHTRQNYSVSEAPYLGKISSVQTNIGAGIEHRIKTPGHFVALFAEARSGKAISISSSSELFSKTNPSMQFMFDIGVAFGYNR
jgi:hypothetical protein